MAAATEARIEAWAQAAERASRHSPDVAYEEYLRRGRACAKEVAQIDLDVPRTPVSYWNADADGGELNVAELHACLRDVLVAWVGYATTHLDAALPYVQGMTLIAFIPVYVLSDEEAAFWVFVLIYTRCLSPDVFARRPALAGHRADTLLLQRLCRERHPDLVSKFGGAELDGAVALLSTKWLLPVFSNALPKESVLSLWDSLVKVPDTKAGNSKYALPSSPLFIWAMSIIGAVKHKVVAEAKRALGGDVPVDVQLAGLFAAAAKALPLGFKVEWTEVPKWNVSELLLQHKEMAHSLEMQRLSRKISQTSVDGGTGACKKGGGGAFKWVAKKVTKTTKIVTRPAATMYSMLPAMPRPFAGGGQAGPAVDPAAAAVRVTPPPGDPDSPPLFSNPPSPQPDGASFASSTPCPADDPIASLPPVDADADAASDADSQEGLTPGRLLLEQYPLDGFWSVEGDAAPAAAPTASAAAADGSAQSMRSEGQGSDAGAAARAQREKEKDLLDFLMGVGPRQPAPAARAQGSAAAGILGQVNAYLPFGISTSAPTPASSTPVVGAMKPKGGGGASLDEIFGAPPAAARPGPSAYDYLPSRSAISSLFYKSSGGGGGGADAAATFASDDTSNVSFPAPDAGYVDPFTLAYTAPEDGGASGFDPPRGGGGGDAFADLWADSRQPTLDE